MRRLPLQNPPQRFSSQQIDLDDETHDLQGPPPDLGLELVPDRSRRVLSRNESPDLGFRWSVNPYRGCYHGCAYCYARPTHEYLGWGAGTDFERRLQVKYEVEDRLREGFEARAWQGELVLFSGNTDCYQPLEAELRLTRACLEVCREYRNPVHVITKAPLVERDVDVLRALADVADVGVTLSIPFWDATHARALEPQVATPHRRMRTVERLAAAGLSVGVNVAPIVPGLSDCQLVPILKAASDAGAQWAACTMLRLPHGVQEVFERRLRDQLPLRADRVLARIREARGGELDDTRFGSRMRGQGKYWQSIEDLFRTTVRRLGLGSLDRAAAPSTTFRRPTDRGQLRLFD